MVADPEVAVLLLHRFGFGPRPGTIAAIASDPRGALIAELDQTDVGKVADAGLLSSGTANRVAFEFNAARQARQRLARRQEAARQEAARLVADKATTAMEKPAEVKPAAATPPSAEPAGAIDPGAPRLPPWGSGGRRVPGMKVTALKSHKKTRGWLRAG
jgi:uncharacterized protein (DUF1800 family)